MGARTSKFLRSYPQPIALIEFSPAFDLAAAPKSQLDSIFSNAHISEYNRHFANQYGIERDPADETRPLTLSHYISGDETANVAMFNKFIESEHELHNYVYVAQARQANAHQSEKYLIDIWRVDDDDDPATPPRYWFARREIPSAVFASPPELAAVESMNLHNSGQDKTAGGATGEASSGHLPTDEGLHASGARFRAISENIPLGVFMTDSEGICTYMNQISENLLGVNVETAAEKGLFVNLKDDDKERALNAWNDLRNRQRDHFEDRFRFRRDSSGEDVWVQIKAAPVYSREDIVGYVGIVEDVSTALEAEREREYLLQRESRARLDAEDSNHLKDEFLATLSHELRTPLTATLGWVRMLRAQQLDEKSKAHALETIERNILLQKRLIEDLLDISRVVSGKLQLEVQPLMLNDVVEASVNSILPSAEIKHLEVNTALEANSGPVYADPKRIQQIVSNLMTNAVKFTPKKGRIAVSLRRVESYVQIEVEDSGIGIRPDFLPHVFERFRQADGSSTRQHGGLGLGLAIVRQLTEAHGGEVWAESEGEGEGSTFFVRLPLMSLLLDPSTRLNREDKTIDLPLTIGTMQASEIARLDDKRILIVDDEQDNLDLLELVLQRFGAQVTTASSAAAALEQIRAQTFDLLISDIGMPGEDGYQLITKVRALAPKQGGALPAIALTAYAKASDKQRAHDAGFDRHVAKPVEPADIVNIAAQLVAESKVPLH